MLGGDHIINHNDRFNPIAGRSLEGPSQIGWPMHWEEQDLKAKLSARSFYCAHSNICAGVRFVPEDGHSGNARESLFEQRKPLSA